MKNYYRVETEEENIYIKTSKPIRNRKIASAYCDNKKVKMFYPISCIEYFFKHK